MVGENTLERLELGYKTREMETKAKVLFEFQNFYKKAEFKCRLKYLYDVSTKAHINFVGYYKNNIVHFQKQHLLIGSNIQDYRPYETRMPITMEK